MTEVLFYHLERARLESVLPGLLEKSLERGWNALVRVASPERVEALDSLLWTYRDDSFLPHAAAGDGERQPVWLTVSEDNPNHANVLFLVDGAVAAVGDLPAYERCVVIFDGADDDAVRDARGFWKEVTAATLDATYWKQSDSGRWEKQG